MHVELSFPNRTRERFTAIVRYYRQLVPGGELSPPGHLANQQGLRGEKANPETRQESLAPALSFIVQKVYFKGQNEYIHVSLCLLSRTLFH